MEYEGWKAGQALRNVRKSRHLTIEQLSERVNKSPSHINQIELGSRKMSVDQSIVKQVQSGEAEAVLLANMGMM